MRKIILLCLLIVFGLATQRSEVIQRFYSGEKKIVAIYEGNGLNEELTKRYTFNINGRIIKYEDLKNSDSYLSKNSQLLNTEEFKTYLIGNWKSTTIDNYSLENFNSIEEYLEVTTDSLKTYTKLSNGNVIQQDFSIKFKPLAKINLEPQLIMYLEVIDDKNISLLRFINELYPQKTNYEKTSTIPYDELSKSKLKYQRIKIEKENKTKADKDKKVETERKERITKLLNGHEFYPGDLLILLDDISLIEDYNESNNMIKLVLEQYSRFPHDVDDFFKYLEDLDPISIIAIDLVFYKFPFEKSYIPLPYYDDINYMIQKILVNNYSKILAE